MQAGSDYAIIRDCRALFFYAQQGSEYEETFATRCKALFNK
jgi:hypothetical protein